MSKRGKKFTGKSLTKQSYTKQCDINRILAKFQRTGTISHISANNHYSDLPEISYEEACMAKAYIDNVYYTLPSEIRREITSPGEFQQFVKTHSEEEIAEKLPMLAEPGNQWPAMNAKQALEGANPDEVTDPPSPSAKTPEKGSEEPKTADTAEPSG